VCVVVESLIPLIPLLAESGVVCYIHHLTYFLSNIMKQSVVMVFSSAMRTVMVVVAVTQLVAIS
jgi:hypothetical protein